MKRRLWRRIIFILVAYLPHKAAHKISELNLFLYLRISGVSDDTSCPVGVTLTLTWLSRREAFPPEPPVPPPLPVEPAPNPKVRNERCFCCNGRNWCWEPTDELDGECCNGWGDAALATNDLEGVDWTDDGCGTGWWWWDKGMPPAIACLYWKRKKHTILYC